MSAPTDIELKRGDCDPEDPEPLRCATCAADEECGLKTCENPSCQKRICADCAIKRHACVLCRECWILECRAVMQLAFELDLLLCRIRDDFGPRPSDEPMGASDIQAELQRIAEDLAAVV